MKDNQVRSTWRFDAWPNSRWRRIFAEVRFDAWTNSRWRRIFAKVEFVVFVSNIMYELGYVWT